MKVGKIKFLLLAIIGCFYATFAYSAVSLFSEYGQIQGVLNYSTNPFWTPKSPYNQKTPQPVYVKGTNVSDVECQQVIESAVTMQCMARNNCKDTTLSDIRPAIIIQLSNLPNKAYSTACIGYLDTIYESYIAKYGNNAPTGQVAFPTGTVPNPSMNNNAPIIQNPYEIKTPQWQKEIQNRSNELQQLQQQNGAGNYGLSAADFPATYQDASFLERVENDAQGYKPFEGKTAYNTINVKNREEWCKEHGTECRAVTNNGGTSGTNSTVSNSTKNGTNTIANKQIRSSAQDIIKILQPANADEERFFTALATNYVEERSKNASLMLDNQFIYDFFSADANRIQTYKSGLQNLETKQSVKDGNVNINWTEAMSQVSTILDDSKKLRGALLCENNRSYQMGLDVALIAAAVATVYFAGSAIAGASGVLAKGAAIFKYTALAAAGGIIVKTVGSYANDDISRKNYSQSAAGFMFSLFDSDARTDVINCQGLDKREKCYNVCGQAGTVIDDLNKKVFNPILGKNYCVSEADFTIYEIETKRPLMMTQDQYATIREKLNHVQDKGGCDWNEDDIDMFIGPYLYDPKTMEPSTNLLIEEVVRLDD